MVIAIIVGWQSTAHNGDIGSSWNNCCHIHNSVFCAQVMDIISISMENLHHSEDEPKAMSLQLLNEITNNFSEERKLGSGMYGDVYKGIQNGEEIAVKRLRTMLGVNDLEQFKKEFENLWRLRHPNIVRLLGYCYEIRCEFLEIDGKLRPLENIFRALCFEYMPNGSLQTYLYDEYHGPNWQTRYRIIKGVCEGLKYLHEGLETPIYHLDLKPDNILLDKNMIPKLADFGLSKLVCNDQTHATQNAVGTIGYLPPEYIDEKLLSKKLDIFSLGVVMIRIMTGYEGYYKKHEMSSQEFIDLVHDNWRNRLKVTQDCSSVEYECHQVKRCIKIALDCVNSDRNQRPQIGTIVQWLNETDLMTQILAVSLPHETRHKTTSHVGKIFKAWSTKDDSNPISIFSSASIVNSQSGQCTPESQGKVYNFNLYMHQIINGPNHNQVNIADPKQPRLFGYTNVHDYPLYDSSDAGGSANIVARVQGLHTETSMNYNDWFHWSSIVFSDKRFQWQSSFVAIGNLTEEGEWAIIGGTGAFCLARGTISICRIIQHDESSNIKEIRIRAICCTPKTVSVETKIFSEDSVIKDYFVVASNVGSPSMANQLCPMSPPSQGKEYNLNLYMHQIIEGANRNQVNLADPKQPQMFGYTNVHDYPMYDSLGPNANIIARAQGLHSKTSMNYNDWFHWSNIVFCDERLRGSSMVAIGNLTHKGEWAIVGGTGAFTFVQGTMSIQKIQQIGSSNIKGIRISALWCKSGTTSTEIEPIEHGLIKHDSDTTLNVGNPSMENPQSGHFIKRSWKTEYNLKLYMHQIIDGPSHNQVNIADPKQPQMFGYTNVHDYPIYDSIGRDAKIVARAQGLHTEASMNYNDWFHWSSIVFNDERFPGSSIVAIGNITHEGEWAIVGGTGLFTFAQGTISISRIQHNDSSNIKEIRICQLSHAN